MKQKRIVCCLLLCVLVLTFAVPALAIDVSFGSPQYTTLSTFGVHGRITPEESPAVRSYNNLAVNLTYLSSSNATTDKIAFWADKYNGVGKVGTYAVGSDIQVSQGQTKSTAYNSVASMGQKYEVRATVTWFNVGQISVRGKVNV